MDSSTCNSPAIEEWVVRLINVRRMGNRLTFADCAQNETNDPEDSDTLSVVFSADTMKSESVPLLFVGDLVKASGPVGIDKRNNRELRCEQYEVIESPKDKRQPAKKKIKLEETTDQRKTTLCLFFRRGVPCKEEGCKFRHFFIDTKEEQNVLKIREKATLQKIKEIDTNDTAPQDKKQPKSHRAKCFVDWLIQKYGKEFLNSGTGVLDVAGGHGYVTLRLLLSGIKSTIMDPRAPTIHPKILKNKFGIADPTTFHIPTIQHLFGLESLENEHQNFVMNASIIIGMHPDQATEPIVDVALKINKPFAVVPCCVFPKLFPNRTLANGNKVILTSEFCDYLIEKIGQNSQVEYLKIAGDDKKKLFIFSIGGIWLAVYPSRTSDDSTVLLKNEYKNQ